MKLTKQIFGFASMLVLSLSAMTQNNQTDTTEFFHQDNFIGDTLYIKGRFMECGEFGGHMEISKIYIKENDFYLTYKKYFADCSKIKENYGEPPQTLVQTITKVLFNKEKLLIRQYFHQLIDAKFREPSPMHAGYLFEIKKTNNSINLYVYTPGEKTRFEYSEFIRQLLE